MATTELVEEEEQEEEESVCSRNYSRVGGV